MHSVHSIVQFFLDHIVKDALSVLGGGYHVEYFSGGGLFLFYWDKTPASAQIQDAMYVDDMVRCRILE